MIVTDTHLFASTAQDVYAVDLAARESVWSHPVGGHLALADGTLYVASADGTLTAISAPTVVPAPLVRIEITGPARVVESSSASYRAQAHYGDGSVRERTLQSEWSVAPDRFAAITGPGLLETRELIQPTHDVVLKVSYTERGQTVEGTLAVQLVIGVAPTELIRRNLMAAIETKRGILHELDAALERERASLSVLRDLPPSKWNYRARVLVSSAICRQEEARGELEWSIYELAKVIATQSASGSFDTPLPPVRRRSDCRTE
jgi:hypothetical protein